MDLCFLSFFTEPTQCCFFCWNDDTHMPFKVTVPGKSTYCCSNVKWADGSLILSLQEPTIFKNELSTVIAENDFIQTSCLRVSYVIYKIILCRIKSVNKELEYSRFQQYQHFFHFKKSRFLQ